MAAEKLSAMDTSGNPQEDKTLLEWVVAASPGVPRKRIKEWIAEGRVQLDGAVATQAGLRLADPADRLTVGAPDAGVAAWSHRKRIHPKLVVLHLDASVAVVEKGPGLLSVSHEGATAPSALDVLAEHLNDPRAQGLRRRLFGKRRPQPLPVHRLDQYTSGVLLFAMNPEARADLIEQVRSRRLRREYLAYADGIPEPLNGSWEHWMRLDENGYRQYLCEEDDEGASAAMTHFETLEVFRRPGVSKLRLTLDTGLKHQIRIQAAAVGLPLLGDRVYHEQTRRVLEKGGKAPFGLNRQALHAAVIGLTHPEDGRVIRFESHLPPDLGKLETRLRTGVKTPS